MELLVNRYGYPVNGAAGLVGNLIAESGVQPNRIEGSHAATPMRAPDFAGRVRDWTPDEVRDRSFSRRTGPRLPASGSRNGPRPTQAGLVPAHLRRAAAGLGDPVRPRRAGRLPGHRAARPYRPVDAALRSPGVTMEQASDAVVLRFERPASVINRPFTDPGVQSVINRPRAHGARALQIS